MMSFVIIILPLLLTAFLLDNSLQKHLAGDVSSQIQADLSAASLAYQMRVSQVNTSVQTIAQDNTVKTTLRLHITGQLQKQLEGLAERMHLDFLVVLDRTGKIILPGTMAVMGMEDCSSHPYVKAAMKAKVSGGSILEETPALLYILEQKKHLLDFKPMVFIETAAPITLRNSVLGVVLGGVLVTDNQELVSSIQAVSRGDQVAIVAADRLVVSTQLLADNTRGRQVFFPVALDYTTAQLPDVEKRVLTASAGEKMVYGYLPLKTSEGEPELALVILRPLSVLLRIVTRFRYILLCIFGSGLLLASVVAVIMSRSIARPLHAITCSMAEIKQGKRVDPIISAREDEIGEMVAGFNDMAMSLDKRLRELRAEIKSREQTEDRLAAESERFRVTLQSMDDAVLASDIDGNVVLMNRVAENFTGWGREEAVGQQLADVLAIMVPGRDDEQIDPLQWLKNQWAGEAAFDGDLQLRSVDGQSRLVTLSGSPLIDRQFVVIGAVMVIRDVTGHRRMEQELVKTQKLESVGVLAGGIAHDFNNILTAILGNLSLAGMASNASDPHYQNIKDAEKATLRAQKLTKQLLTFSRGGSPVKETVELAALLRESAEFVSHGASVRLRFFVEDDIWPVSIDRGQIGQVIDNLVINALQASPEGGFIDIRLANFKVEDEILLPVHGKRFVRITVQDYGTGIMAAHVDKVFDPYFTTKEMGSGLGLSICFSIVNKHGGYITVDSQPGRGSIFEVYLPAEKDRPVPVDEIQEGTPTSLPSGKRILVLDDEEMVLSVVGQMLETMGYTVDGVAEGSEVLEKYTQAMQQGEPYQVVILDLTIPGGMGGEEVVQRLQAIDPAVRAIVASGYSDHRIMAEYRQYGFVGVVAKPFRIKDLDLAVREALNS